MAEIRFTAEERSYLAQVAASRTGLLPTLGSYLPYLAPLAIFGAYGLAAEDVIAIGLAFVCLLAINLWWIQQQSQHSALLKALAAKLLGEAEAEPAADDRQIHATSAGPGA
ncbi:hypothetical protein ASE63_02925 [Bosea sp. Root381]|uniref:hypothetical protein n=1 Tax=Bosea sp. Root381 TaxID=1736524 RepID=UPI0006FC5FF8|nr:hypothetical protein [Bosea sp. Root381]KRE18147.1 hypothetical protein ASE63_02925 [Bosea sp. Root381]